jgi:hypothetical protein
MYDRSISQIYDIQEVLSIDACVNWWPDLTVPNKSLCRVAGIINIQGEPSMNPFTTEIYQPLTPLNGHKHVKVIWNSVSSSRLDARASYSASKSISSSLTYPVVMHSLTQLTPRFPYLTSNSECVRRTAACICSMHYRRHAHSCNTRIVHLG